MFGFYPIYGCHNNNSFANTIRTWSNINCGLASAATFAEQKANGVNTWDALSNFSSNLINGGIRNEWAYRMERHGNSYGNYINSYVGYGNPYSNMIGTLALTSSMVYNPWMFFNSPCCSYMAGPMSMMPYTMYGGMNCWC